MTAAWWSLIALLVAIVLSIATRLNIGILAIAFAWIIGVYGAGWRPEQVVAGFPATLFLTLTGVTLLFAIAETNGTLEAISQRALRPFGRRVGVLPVALFLVAGIISSLGPGSIVAVALLVPMAMAIATTMGISPILTSLMVANGANAGNLSPLSSVGIIANTKMAEVGLGGHEFKVWLANFLAHVVVAAAALVFFRGRAAPSTGSLPEIPRLTTPQRATLIVISGWIVGVVGLGLNVGLSAFAAAAIIVAGGGADESGAIRRVPWGVILMVTGVSVLIGLVEKTGGMEHFTAGLSRLATKDTVNGVIAFVTGLISSYSSTSGVVLPAFLPTAPDLVGRLGGGDPLAVALSINVGSSLVDVSPLSTLGALCVATQGDPVSSKRLFRQLLVWGLTMTVVGALLCQFTSNWMARW